MTAMDSTESNREPVIWTGILSTGLIVFLCGLAGLSSENGCGGDETFSLDSPLARPSGFCRATHFPGFPDTVGSALLVGAVYVTPVLVVALGWLTAATAGRRRIGEVSFMVGIALTVAVIVLSMAVANVGYEGAG